MKVTLYQTIEDSQKVYHLTRVTHVPCLPPLGSMLSFSDQAPWHSNRAAKVEFTVTGLEFWSCVNPDNTDNVVTVLLGEHWKDIPDCDALDMVTAHFGAGFKPAGMR